MKSFKSFLTESYISEALHLTHPEEFAFKYTGSENMFNTMKNVANDMYGKESSGTGVTVKFDGSPAIIFGTHPVTKKFFVSTKGFFAKVSKAAYTENDIDTLFESEGLRPKLKIALRYLPELNPKGVYQGDMMFTKDDIKTKKIDDQTNYIFTPNTISYVVPVSSILGKTLSTVQLGIVIHTKYNKAKSIPEMLENQSFDVNVDKDFKNSTNVWAIDGSIEHTKTPLTALEHKKIISNLTQAESLITKNSTVGFPKELLSRLEIYVNQLIRKGKMIEDSNDFVDGFLKYYSTFIDSEKLKFKTTTKKESLEKQLATITATVNNKKSVIVKLSTAYKLIYDAKMILVEYLSQLKSDIKTYVKSDGVFQIVKPEGFVVSDANNTVKLVDRLEFSKHNFNLVKDWVK